MESFKEIRFPEHLATSVRQSKFHVIENRDISDPDNLHRLLRLLFDFPERSFYLFVQKQAGLTDQLRQAVDSGDVLITQTDLEFYPHPNFKHDYVRIRRGQESFHWEKEVVASATEYIRFTLVLSERKRRAMEIDLHLDAHSRKSANPLKLEQNVWGIGIDLKKAFWIDAVVPGREPVPLEFRRELQEAWMRHYSTLAPGPVVEFRGSTAPEFVDNIQFVRGNVA